MPAWLVSLLAAGAFTGALVTVLLALMSWRLGSSSERDLRGIRADLERLSHLHTTAAQRRLEIAAEALGATIRFGVLVKQAGETPSAWATEPHGKNLVLYLRDALDRAWSDLGPVERRFEQAWDQASVHLQDERVPELMERLWRLKESRRREQQSSLAAESSTQVIERERRAGPNPRLLQGPEFEKYIQFVEAVDDIVREAKEIVRPMVKTALRPPAEPPDSTSPPAEQRSGQGV